MHIVFRHDEQLTKRAALRGMTWLRKRGYATKLARTIKVRRRRAGS